MPSINPTVLQWIRQMDDDDQVIGYYAYQCLLEEVMHASAPGQEELQGALCAAIGEALVAEKETGERAQAQGASFANNPFLAAVASQSVDYVHPPRARANLARLLGYLPHEAATPYLARALRDLDAREMARYSLECHPAESAANALIDGLNLTGSVFCAGVVNSLAKRKGERVVRALRNAAEDPHLDVRLAALDALAEIPEPDNDAILEKATRSPDSAESRKAHVARARLAETLRANGDRQAAERIYQSILSSDAGEPQKKAARLALGIATKA